MEDRVDSVEYVPTRNSRDITGYNALSKRDHLTEVSLNFFAYC